MEVAIENRRSDLPSAQPSPDWAGRTFATPRLQGSLSLREVVRLRWLAISVQAAAVCVLAVYSESAWVTPPLFGILGLAAVSNLVLPAMRRFPTQHVLGAVALIDVVLLTGLLTLAGGPSNPFSVLYLIYVMLAAIAAGPRWTWPVVAVSSAGFGLLFFLSVPLPEALGGHHGHGGQGEGHQPYSAHLQGMWLAYTVTAAAIGGFVSRLSDALRQEREERSKTSRLLGLATLAAGAAHEIGNPLGTIRVAASELEHDLTEAQVDPEVLDDLRLIGAEVGRAHRVLERMSIGAGELIGEGPVATDLSELLDVMVAQLPDGADRVRISGVPAGKTVRWPLQATTQALSQLVRNALMASTEPVHVSVELGPECVSLQIIDRGVGMPPEVLERIGEPFFSTRGNEGQGLGVFIARSLIEHLGGSIAIYSSVGQGTRVQVRLPENV